jgi:hypothetical protein
MPGELTASCFSTWFMFESHVKCQCARKCLITFCMDFPRVTIPSIAGIHTFVNKVRSTTSLLENEILVQQLLHFRSSTLMFQRQQNNERKLKEIISTTRYKTLILPVNYSLSNSYCFNCITYVKCPLCTLITGVLLWQNVPERHSRTSFSEGWKLRLAFQNLSFPDIGITNTTLLQQNFESHLVFRNTFKRKIILPNRKD